MKSFKFPFLQTVLLCALVRVCSAVTHVRILWNRQSFRAIFRLFRTCIEWRQHAFLPSSQVHGEHSTENHTSEKSDKLSTF